MVQAWSRGMRAGRAGEGRHGTNNGLEMVHALPKNRTKCSKCFQYTVRGRPLDAAPPLVDPYSIIIMKKYTVPFFLFLGHAWTISRPFDVLFFTPPPRVPHASPWTVFVCFLIAPVCSQMQHVNARLTKRHAT